MVFLRVSITLDRTWEPASQLMIARYVSIEEELGLLVFPT